MTNSLSLLLGGPSEEKIICPICGYNAGSVNGEEILKQHLQVHHPNDREATFNIEEAPTLLEAEYLGWSPNYSGGVGTQLILVEGGLIIAQLNPPLSIRYQDIEGIEVIPSKQTTAGRIALTGPLLASAWKKMEWFLCIRYRDDAGIQINLMFDPASVESLDEFVKALYKKLRDAKQAPTDNPPHQNR